MIDLVFTETRTGVRAHRATCKRANDPTLIGFTDPLVIAEALPASCCKPNKSEVAALATAARASADEREERAQRIKDADVESALEALDGLGRRQAEYRDARQAKIDENAKLAQTAVAHAEPKPFSHGLPSEDDEPAPFFTVVHLSEARVAKHYWKDFGAAGGTMVAEAFGVEVNVVGQQHLVKFIGDLAPEAREALLDLWVQGYAAFKVWKRTDEAYRALPVLHGATSVRAIAERVWLRAFVADRAESFGVL